MPNLTDFNEEKIIDTLAIRDTINHDSVYADSRQFSAKTIIIENGLNQDVTVQLQGSRDSDFTNPLDCGNSFVVNATSDSYSTIGDYFPFFRIQLICSTAPTTGTITVYIEKVR